MQVSLATQEKFLIPSHPWCCRVRSRSSAEGALPRRAAAGVLRAQRHRGTSSVPRSRTRSRRGDDRRPPRALPARGARAGGSCRARGPHPRPMDATRHRFLATSSCTGRLTPRWTRTSSLGSAAGLTCSGCTSATRGAPRQWSLYSSRARAAASAGRVGSGGNIREGVRRCSIICICLSPRSFSSAS